MIDRNALLLLDTNVILYLLRGKAAGRWITETYELGARVERPLVSVVSVGEILAIAERQGYGTDKRESLRKLLDELVVVNVKWPIAKEYARLQALLQAVSATLILCGTTAWLLWPAHQAITAETHERLCRGMARAEAEELLGGTHEDFVDWLNNRSPKIGSGNDLLNEQSNQPGIEYWYEDSGVILVRFDSEGRVADKQFLEMRVSTFQQRIARSQEGVGRLVWQLRTLAR